MVKMGDEEQITEKHQSDNPFRANIELCKTSHFCETYIECVCNDVIERERNQGVAETDGNIKL